MHRSFPLLSFPGSDNVEILSSLIIAKVMRLDAGKTPRD